MLTQADEKKAYFNRYWHTRDLPSADARSLQRAHMVRSLMDDPGSGKVIDIGCGRGLVMNHLSTLGYTVCGCDLATDAITPLADEGHDVFVLDIERDEVPGKYDAVLCLEVLQQLFDPETALRKCARALDTKGYLIVSVPNEFHIWSRIRLLIGKSHLGHFEESHIRLFNPRRSKQLFARVGLSVKQVVSVPIIPPRMKMLEGFGKFLARLSPDLFSLSQIYRLEKS